MTGDLVALGVGSPASIEVLILFGLGDSGGVPVVAEPVILEAAASVQLVFSGSASYQEFLSGSASIESVFHGNASTGAVEN